MATPYNHKAIEKKWRENWAANKKGITNADDRKELENEYNKKLIEQTKEEALRTMAKDASVDIIKDIEEFTRSKSNIFKG